ncbi:MAG TPA: alpha/beta hydrolase [Acidimicrobiales bacterium]|nr:alpha/beta hydrolase [Acidimicrobiales bacterium]
MTTFVLVHGAWSGAHGFHLVRPMLRDAGHDVFTPSLTGLGERVHLASPQVDLSTHVTDVVNHVLYEDHRDFVLLGFSYGGAVVTGALDHIGDRVRHLVYLDAFVPADGESLVELNGAPRPPFPLTGLGLEWLVPPSPREFDDPAEGEFINARRVPHPMACFAEPVRLSKPLEEWPFTRTYIRATADESGAIGPTAFERCAAHAAASPAWTLHEIPTNHMVPSNRPRELADILLRLA